MKCNAKFNRSFVAVITLLITLLLIVPEISGQTIYCGRSHQGKRSGTVIELLTSNHYGSIDQQEEPNKEEPNAQQTKEETPAAREKRLLERMEKVVSQMASLQSKLNELRLRVLQNRPGNPLVFGDPYYVDPKLREQITKIRRQLLETQMEFEDLVSEIEGR